MDALGRTSRGLARLETALAQVSALAMFLIMAVVVADVLLRYFFSMPLIFSYDLISMYLMVIVFFFALPDTLHRHGHIAIDFFQPYIAARLRFVAEALGYAAATLVMVLIAWKLSGRTWTAFVRDEVTATTIPWPVWLSSLPAAIGCWLFAARALYRCVAHVASAIAGSARVELPPPPLTSREEENPL